MLRGLATTFIVCTLFHIATAADGTCPSGKWNPSDCDKDCHCLGNVQCNLANGACPNGKCADAYYSSNCQNVKPKLSGIVNVTKNDCGGLTLVWNCWKKGQDVGDAGEEGVTKYKVIETHDGVTSFSLTINEESGVCEAAFGNKLNTSTKYIFTVIPIFQYLASELEGVPTLTPETVRTCDYKVPTPADPKVQQDGPTGFNVSWSTAEHADVISNIFVSMQKLHYGECSLLSPLPKPSEQTVAFASKAVSLATNDPWTEFRITIKSLDSKGVPSLAITNKYFTEETVPNVTISNLKVNPGETNALVSWEKPPCFGQGGSIVQYDLAVLAEDKTDPRNFFTKDLKYNVPGLEVATDYSITVSFRTSKGSSPPTKVLFKTKGTRPTTTSAATPPPTTTTSSTTALFVVRVDSIGLTWVNLAWNELPSKPSRYKLTYNSVTKLTPDLSYNITEGLVPATSYTVKVVAIKLRVEGGETELQSSTAVFTMRPAVKSFTLKGLKNNVSSPTVVDIQWTPPDSSGMRVSGLVIQAVPISSSVKSPKVVTKSAPSEATSYQVSGLSPATQYKLTVMPMYGSIPGSPAAAVFWTGPGPMTMKPPKPDVSAVTEYTFDLLVKPINYTQGPLQYYIFVSKYVSGVNRRRKRDITPTMFSLPSNAVLVESLGLVPKDGTKVSIGDNSNAKDQSLESGTEYVVYYVATSAILDSRVSSHVEVRVKTQSRSLAWIAALIVILLLLILVVVLLFLLWRRRKSRKDEMVAQSLKLKLSNGGIGNGTLQKGHHHLPVHFKHWSDTERINDSRYMVLDPQYGPRDLKVDSIRNRESPEDYESFEKEYRSLPWGLEHPCHTGRLPENAEKNRNSNILPYDHCRVTLDRAGTRMRGTDYVNASFIDGYLRRRAYIAAQSPFDEETVADFWLMVYQYNVNQVVMMTEMLEEATMKCMQYWPDAGSAVQYGAIYVTCTSEDAFAYFTIRSFQMVLKGSAQGARQEVQQYQFHGWPEHGVPSTPLQLLDMYTRVKMEAREHFGPLLVHCGTGVSRTAVFIALDSLLQQAIHENVVNVYKFCVKMRRARPNMIRTARQYMFLYDLIFEALLASNQIVNLDVQETFRQLSEKNHMTGHSYLWEQHAILEKYTPELSDSECTVAVMAENKRKNRFASNLPSDEHRVRLFSSPGSGDYINAVFVDSHYAIDDLILTQIPFQHTLSDFWHMVLDHHVTCIVDMEPEHHNRDGAVDWYPSDDVTRRIDGGIVLHSRAHIDLQPFPGVTMRRVTVNDGERSVRIYSPQPGVWKDPYSKIPSHRMVLCHLVQAVRSDADIRSGPLTVVCMDGATRSGLYAACHLTAQRISADHFVDVFHTVKSMKVRRTRAVPHLEQYKFVFKFLWDFVRQYMSAEYQREVSNHSLLGHLPTGELESIYSHTQTPVLHAEQGPRAGSGIHYHYADKEAMNTTTM